MKQRKLLYIIIGVVVIVGLWAAFRPELLFVKKSVDEPLPGATGYYHATANKILAQRCNVRISA